MQSPFTSHAVQERSGFSFLIYSNQESQGTTHDSERTHKSLRWTLREEIAEEFKLSKKTQGWIWCNALFVALWCSSDHEICTVSWERWISRPPDKLRSGQVRCFCARLLDHGEELSTMTFHSDLTECRVSIHSTKEGLFDLWPDWESWVSRGFFRSLMQSVAPQRSQTSLSGGEAVGRVEHLEPSCEDCRSLLWTTWTFFSSQDCQLDKTCHNWALLLAHWSQICTSQNESRLSPRWGPWRFRSLDGFNAKQIRSCSRFRFLKLL